MPRPKSASTSPNSSPTRASELVSSVDRLAGEIRCLREVMVDIRTELDCVPKNGEAVNPRSHMLLKKMARDPFDPARSEKLEIEHLLSEQVVDPESALNDYLAQLGTVIDNAPDEQLETLLQAVELIKNDVLFLIGERGKQMLAASIRREVADSRANPPQPVRHKRQSSLF